jgi:hypothetical protein
MIWDTTLLDRMKRLNIMKTIYTIQVWVENEDDIIDDRRKKNKVGIRTRF